MEIRSRPTVRSLLIAVAIVALGIGSTFEWRNRRARNYYARAEAHCFVHIEKHERELAYCRSQMGRAVYDARRRDENFEGRWTNFESWDEEAAWHDDFAKDYRRAVPELARLKQFYQRRLLLP